MLELSSYGTTCGETQKNFNEIFKIFVEEEISDGTLLQNLQACVWTYLTYKAHNDIIKL